MIVQVAQERSFQVGECQLGRMTDRRFLGSGANLLNQGAKLFQNDLCELAPWSYWQRSGLTAAQ
jgi:hypothetical protein